MNDSSLPRVCILAGGTSSEREVSLRSAASVANALQSKGFEVTTFDTQNELTADALRQIDVVFPVLHGLGGEDGTIQRQLDRFGVAYVGTGAEASALCFDKWRYKAFLREHSHPVPNGEMVDGVTFWTSALSQQPFVLKPNDGGSSVDTLIAREGAAGLDKSLVDALFARHPQMLIEELITGTEITVAVLDTQALPVIEIIPPVDGEFDYENKYNGATQELCPPQNVSEATQAQAQQLASLIHLQTGCRDFSRTDMMIGAGGELYVLETNTIPGMTDQSLFPKAAATAGISMPELVEKLVLVAASRP